MSKINNPQLIQFSSCLLGFTRMDRGIFIFFRLFGLIIVALSVTVVTSNNLQYLHEGKVTLNFYVYILGLLLGLSQRYWSWAIFIATIPLLANSDRQLQAFLDIHIISLPAPGLDLVSGFFVSSILALLVSHISKKKLKPDVSLFESKSKSMRAFIKAKMPWPIGLALFLISIQVVIAVARNLYQSAAVTSIKGILFNLSHFRPMPWRADFMPVADLIAYGISAAALVICLMRLGNNSCRIQMLFRPLLFSLAFSILIAVIQSTTGAGLALEMHSFRKDFLGSAAIGFYPDIHSFAGFMLLGSIGLWGYYATKKFSLEGRIVLVVIALSWLGLLLSKSRSSLLIALCTVAIYGSVKAYQYWSPKVFCRRVMMSLAFMVLGLPLLLMIFWPENVHQRVELLSHIFSSNGHYLQKMTQEFGGRPELFKAALYMFAAFPFMGIGQGEFYRQSSNEGFSHSFLLSAWGGENAHNYFLQTLAETGLIGVAIFAFIILVPFFTASQKSNLKVPYIALGSLFLGNLYSHAFLIRENLLLAALFLGVLYSYSLVNESSEVILTDPKKRFGFVKMGLIATLIGGMSLSAANEVYRSFGKIPYLFGSECFVNRPLSRDGWTSGLFMKHIPRHSSEVFIDFDLARGDISLKKPLRYRLEIVNRHQETVAFTEGVWTMSTAIKLHLARPVILTESEPREDSFILRLGSCYIPRDLGVSLDDRLLGVKIHALSFR